ncbi:MAG: hypothetical protein LW635_12245 [Microcystis sp. 53598_E5]|jgi:hypothetical protein|nr:hypothetical protein [Microcystis sp. 53598_E5]
MAVKTFTSEVLTSADTNTYLANAGWVYVNSGTFSASSAVQVNSVFTSTYTNYKLVLQDLRLTAGTNSVSFQLSVSGTPSSTGYYSGSQYWTFAVTPSSAAFGDSNAASFTGLYVDATVRSSAEFTLYNVQQALATNIIYNTVAFTNTFRNGGGTHNVATAYDGFRIVPASSTISGTWSVYGQRSA